MASGTAPPDFDAICIGCGPSGNLVAYLLARAGWRVLLLDRRPLPRGKVCGGGLSARALTLLPYDISPVVHQHMQGANLALAGRVLGEVASAGIGAMIERAEFDAFMTAQAVAAGAQVRDGEAIEDLGEDRDGVWVRTTCARLSARLLIGADGARSTVRALLFPEWRAQFAFGIEAHYRWPADRQPAPTQRDWALFDFGTLDQGYGWVFPKRDHFNVGIYRIQKPRRAASLKQALSAFEGQHPGLASCTATRSLGHPIPLSDGRQPVGRGRSILVGDAAGLGEAFLGEGIAFALQSAHLAAAWAIAAFAGECAAGHLACAAGRGLSESARFRPARPWEASLRPLIGELRYSLRIARLLYLLPPPLLQRAVGAAAIQQLVVGLLQGRRTYRQTFWQLMAALPAALLRAPRPGAETALADGQSSATLPARD
jgi:geranylgeranyl reductase family protein